MPIKIRFFGASQNVTGSSYVLETSQAKILIDCGLYQERKLRDRNWHEFPFDPNDLDAVILTHAHVDHSGRLPKLVTEGFDGPIFCTQATADIARIILLDSAHIQEEDALFKQRRHQREGRTSPRQNPYTPLYTTADVKRTLPLFKTSEYDQKIEVAPGITATLRDAGHILGSASIFVEIEDGDDSRSILFSGDIGRWNTPILRDPNVVDAPDVVVMESTYGNRTHGERDDIPVELARIINETSKSGGNVIVPCFAVERTQELLYHMNGLVSAHDIPRLLTFMDSPMAIRVTEVFKRHKDLFDEATTALIESGNHPCDFTGLKLCRTTDQSKAINHIRGTCMVIAGSGMCTGGRIKHHLEHNIGNEASTILFVGYQAVGTLGRIILDGAKDIRIHGNSFPVRARIERITGFSAHADKNELLQWVQQLKAPPSKFIVTHGEPDAANEFAQELRNTTDAEVHVPNYQDTIQIAP